MEPLQRPYGVTFWREEIMDTLQFQLTVRLDYGTQRRSFAYRRVPLRSMDPCPGIEALRELVIEAHDLMFNEIFNTLTGRY